MIPPTRVTLPPTQSGNAIRKAGTPGRGTTGNSKGVDYSQAPKTGGKVKKLDTPRTQQPRLKRDYETKTPLNDPKNGRSIEPDPMGKSKDPGGTPLKGKNPGKPIDGKPPGKPLKGKNPGKPIGRTPKKTPKNITTGKNPKSGKPITTGGNKGPLSGKKISPGGAKPPITTIPRNLAGKKIPSGMIPATSGPPPGWFSWWLFQRDRYHKTSHLLPDKLELPRGSIALPYDIERSRALGALRAALKDSKPDVRKAAVIALGKVACPGDDVLAAIQTMLRDPQEDVQRAAILSLGLLDREDTLQLLRLVLRRSRQNPHATPYALIGLGYTARGAADLLPILRRSTDRETILATLLGLKAAADPQALPALLTVARNRSHKAQTRALAISAAAGIDPQGSSIPLLERLALDEKQEVAAAAILTLGSSRLPQATEALRRLMGRGRSLKDSSRGWLFLAVGQHRDKTQRKSLEAELGNIQLCGYAAIGLGLMGDKQATRALLRVEADYNGSDHLNHAAIALGLGLLGCEELKKRLSAIWGACADYHDYLMIVAAAVGHLGDSGQIPSLVKQFEDHPWNYDVRRATIVSLCMLDAGDKAVALLQKEVVSKVARRRLYAVRLLGELPRPSHVTRVMAHTLRHDKLDQVRAQAAIALGRSLDRARWGALKMGSLSRLGITFPYQIIRREDLLKELFSLQ